MTDWRGKEALEDRSFNLHSIKEGDDWIGPTNRENRRLLARGKAPPVPGQFTSTQDADKWLKTEEWRQEQERRLAERDTGWPWMGWSTPGQGNSVFVGVDLDSEEFKAQLTTAAARANQFATTMGSLGVYHEPEN